ncbi:hypothetical protein [Bacillus sp. 179-C3.3 HS]|uniref:hypothetical protein n=1 Tax=Bacillus sp. 179-C3.3 HS TaxID=3232162 RepID=UPI0039A1DB12
MILFGLMIYGFYFHPIFSFGTLVLFLYGIIASFIGLRRNQSYRWIYIFRLLVCFTIPVTNLLMYLTTIGGGPGITNLQMNPLPFIYIVIFILEIITIFLPEVFLLIEKKRHIKWKGWIYAGLIVCVSILFWWTI